MVAPQPANAQIRFHNWPDRHHFQRIERGQRCFGNREQHAAKRDRPFVEEYQWSNVRDSEHHARDLGLPAEYRLPLAAINSARALVGQIQGIYNSIRGIWNTAVRSATLANPQGLENVILSKDAGQIGTVAARFSAVYSPLPAATEVHPSTRDVIDSSDAASQAAMKRSMAIDDIADRELAAADQMMAALASTAPGTAEMIGAQAGRLGRSLPGIHATGIGGNDAAPRDRVGGPGRAD